MVDTGYVGNDFCLTDDELADSRLIDQALQLSSQYQSGRRKFLRIVFGNGKADMTYTGGSRGYVAHDYIYLVSSRRKSDGFLVSRLSVLSFVQLFGRCRGDHRIFKNAGTATSNGGNSSKDIDSSLL